MKRALIAFVVVTAAACSNPGGSDDPNPSPVISPTPEPCVQVGTVSGQVLDANGNVPTTTLMSICGNACLFDELDPVDGTFSSEANFCYSASTYDVPVFIYHGVPDYADVTVKFVPTGATDVPSADIGVVTTISTAALATVAYPDPVAATLSDGGGFNVQVAADTVALPFPHKEVMLGEVALIDFPLPTPPSPALTALFFIGPDNTELSAPAIVHFPNTTGLVAGSNVEVLALGNIGTTGVIEAGTFDVVGTGVVSGDGTTINSDPGTHTGLVTFGWIGYRPVP